MIKNVIGVIGQGFVGSAVREKFRENYLVMTYDKFNEDLSKNYEGGFTSQETNKLSDLVKNCDYLFSCVPTPMFEDGQCDTSIVESVIMDLHHECINNLKQVTVICKSTMPPGTTERLNEISTLVNVLFSPEFLTEANAVEDFKNQNRIILGVPNNYKKQNKIFGTIVNHFTELFPNSEIVTTNSTEAEAVKYMTNLFLATKVSFFNDMYQYCQSIGANFDKVKDITLLDKRIGKSHHQVPGPDGELGFGGICLPKDLNAILFDANRLGLKLHTLEGAEKTNNQVRENKDWEKMEGRAVSKRNSNQLELPLEFDHFGQEHC